MRRNTPLITLLAGAALGIILLVASSFAAHGTPAPSAATPTPAPAPTTATEPPSPSPSPSPSAPARASYLGEAHGGTALVEISVRGGRALASVCRGSVASAWLTGSAAAGRLTLSGANGARLSAAYGVRKASGSFVANGIRYTFSVPAVHRPGLYQSIHDHAACGGQGQAGGGGGGDNGGGGGGGGGGH